ncbi:MAG TPA: hypothetical protein PL000_22935 [Anaerolineales bacterium]|nr:hypothetical protein [Anaerolineales bacterium]
MTSKEFVELIGHVAWPVAVLLGLFWMKGALRSFLAAVAARVEDRQTNVAITKDGLEIKALEVVRPELVKLASVSANPGQNLPEGGAIAGDAEPEFETTRDAIYKNNRRLFLVHILEPTKDRTQLYDIFIYIKRHKDAPIDDVVKTEFFFGKFWGNRIFEGTRADGTYGVRTSAYGEFLCTCRVQFSDGESVLLQRYIDFDSGKYLKEVIEEANKSFQRTAASGVR